MYTRALYTQKYPLPKNDGGYGVYVRLLAEHNNDPETDPYIDNIIASLSFAQDELGNQLVYRLQRLRQFQRGL
jgi:hypothetical protein